MGVYDLFIEETSPFVVVYDAAGPACTVKDTNNFLLMLTAYIIRNIIYKISIYTIR